MNDLIIRDLWNKDYSGVSDDKTLINESKQACDEDRDINFVEVSFDNIQNIEQYFICE